MIGHITRMTALPGRRDDVIEAMAPIMCNVAGEAGTLVYAVYTDDDPDVLWLHELFTNEAARKVHQANSGHDAYSQTARALLSAPLDVSAVTSAFGKWTQQSP